MTEWKREKDTYTLPVATNKELQANGNEIRKQTNKKLNSNNKLRECVRYKSN